jgi:hypothetical protein
MKVVFALVKPPRPTITGAVSVLYGVLKDNKYNPGETVIVPVSSLPYAFEEVAVQAAL